ncbi:RNA methyltransferase [Moraxella sp. ZJ142]|uniref:RNA methyltransferase n=1 Tax=Moraxella marmotae TaxID=3344520 RepID=UPI0035D527BE
MTTTLLPPPNPLERIRIVMIGTTLPANIGSAARALHTMGLSNLVVVNPRLPIDDSSFANAAGAKDILSKTYITDNLHDAIADCTLIFAASARSRHMPRPVVSPSTAADIVKQQFNLSKQLTSPSDTPSDLSPKELPQIAILFGREDRGLTNEELALANYHIQIPANPAYPVLNVASAIQVIAATFYDRLIHAEQDGIASTKQTQGVAQDTHTLAVSIRSDWDEPAITHEQAANLNHAVIALMQRLGLAHDDSLKHLPNRLARLGSRLQLDKKEYALLRSLIAKIDKKLP